MRLFAVWLSLSLPLCLWLTPANKPSDLNQPWVPCVNPGSKVLQEERTCAQSKPDVHGLPQGPSGACRAPGSEGDDWMGAQRAGGEAMEDLLPELLEVRLLGKGSQASGSQLSCQSTQRSLSESVHIY